MGFIKITKQDSLTIKDGWFHTFNIQYDTDYYILNNN